MTRTSCGQEMAVTNAARSGKWDDLLKEHVQTCKGCQDVAKISGWMQSLAGGEGQALRQEKGLRPAALEGARMDEGSESDEDFALPDASLVWWRARLAEELDARQAKTQRAHAAMDRVEIVAVFIGAIGLAGWVFWNWDGLQGVAARLLIALWPESWAGANPALGSLWLAIAVLSAIAILLAYPILAEE
jgi:hypothetical protein